MSDRKPARTVTVQDLLDHADHLNSRPFSRELGWHWTVVGHETADGTRHSLERRDIRAAANKNWSAPQGEFAGVRASVQTSKGSML